MLGDRSFATRTITTGAFNKLLVTMGCLWVTIVGLMIVGAGVAVASGIKYLFAA